MIDYQAGSHIARSVGMRYSPPLFDDEPHNFDEMRMVNSYWVHHSFFFVESIELCFAQKLDRYGHEEDDDEEVA